MNISIEDAIDLHKIINRISLETHYLGNLYKKQVASENDIIVIFSTDGFTTTINDVYLGNHLSIKAQELIQQYFNEEINEGCYLLDSKRIKNKK